MDLLYTGYVESGMIQKKNNVTIFHPNKTKLERKTTGNYNQNIKRKISSSN